LTLRPLLLGRDALKAFPGAFELRIGVERGAEIVERFALPAKGLLGLGAPGQGERVVALLSPRFGEIAIAF